MGYFITVSYIKDVMASELRNLLSNDNPDLQNDVIISNIIDNEENKIIGILTKSYNRSDLITYKPELLSDITYKLVRYALYRRKRGDMSKVESEYTEAMALLEKLNCGEIVLEGITIVSSAKRTVYTKYNDRYFGGVDL